MTQPQRGSARTEVRDLRNIVDRLDVLMGSPTAAGSQATAQSALGRTLVALTERVDALEREAEELRTLVNHLMTIATWQAKVTATLVGEEDAAEEDEPDDEPREGRPVERPRGQDGSAWHRATHGSDHRDGGGTEDIQRPSPARTLDEDIDDILGTGQNTSGDDAAPPDFGI